MLQSHATVTCYSHMLQSHAAVHNATGCCHCHSCTGCSIAPKFQCKLGSHRHLQTLLAALGTPVCHEPYVGPDMMEVTMETAANKAFPDVDGCFPMSDAAGHSFVLAVWPAHSPDIHPQQRAE